MQWHIVEEWGTSVLVNEGEELLCLVLKQPHAATAIIHGKLKKKLKKLVIKTLKICTQKEMV